MGFLENERREVREYLLMLEPEGVPEWMEDYIATPEMQRLADVSTTCGLIYTELRPVGVAMDSLEHSVGVAMVVWHFTRDKRQALAGLFHDIASPTFKHSVDFLKGDYMKQEATEELTTEIIASSPMLMALLERDGIDVAEVDDYHIYPIADNETPRLSADRLEYTLSHALFSYGVADFETVKRFYEDVKVLGAEDGTLELGFGTVEIAEEFVKKESKLSRIFRDEITRFSLRFLADVLEAMVTEGNLTERDFYEMGDAEMLAAIEASRFAEVFGEWRRAKKIKTSAERPEGVYAVRCEAKVRWIDPLVEAESGARRISEVSGKAAESIRKNLGYKMDKWMYLGFELPR